MQAIKVLSSGENAVGALRTAWSTLSPLPGGKKVFSALVGQLAPYTGSIGAEVVELAEGSSTVILRDRRLVRNHLRCVHAIALANLAELTGNLALSMSMPPGARFIVAGLHIDYLKKARGTITGTGSCPPIPSAERARYESLATMRDASGDVVARATLDVLVGPTRS